MSSELFTQEQAKETEQDFRRGYHQGYEEAVDNIFTLLFNDRMSAEEAYKLVARHANLLGIWRIEECERLALPPPFNREAH